MDGSKCRDVKVGPFSHMKSENALTKGKKKQQNIINSIKNKKGLLNFTKSI